MPKKPKVVSSSFARSSTVLIPAPFTPAPETLAPLLDRLDPAKIYISHLDRAPRATKQSIFLIPVFLNGLIALLLLWRVRHALPTYWALLQTLLGYVSEATVDVERTTRGEQVRIVLWRTGMFAMDFFLVRVVAAWPLTFFLEQPANPVSWRWGLPGSLFSYLDEEAVVRVSRNWGSEELMRGVKQGEDNAFFKTRVLPAISTAQMRKTGYLLMDGNWDLDFELMLDAHTLAKHDQISLREIDEVVFAHVDGAGWGSWKWRGEGVDVDVVEARRKKVVQFKEKLTGMGKESLFWRWMEGYLIRGVYRGDEG